MENKVGNNIKKTKRLFVLVGGVVVSIVTLGIVIALLQNPTPQSQQNDTTLIQANSITSSQESEELSLTYETSVFKINVNSNYVKKITTDNVEATYEGDISLRRAIDNDRFQDIVIQRIPKGESSDTKTFLQSYLERRRQMVEGMIEIKGSIEKNNASTIGFKKTREDSIRIVSVWENTGYFYIITIDQDLVNASQIDPGISDSIKTLNTMQQNLKIK